MFNFSSCWMHFANKNMREDEYIKNTLSFNCYAIVSKCKHVVGRSTSAADGKASIQSGDL